MAEVLNLLLKAIPSSIFGHMVCTRLTLWVSVLWLRRQTSFFKSQNSVFLVLCFVFCVLCNSEKSQNSEKSWNMEKSWKASYSEVKGKSKAQQVLNFNFIV